MVVGVILMALGLKEVLGYVGGVEEHTLTDPIYGVPLVALYGGAALYLLAHVGFLARMVEWSAGGGSWPRRHCSRSFRWRPRFRHWSPSPCSPPYSAGWSPGRPIGTPTSATGFGDPVSGARAQPSAPC